MMSWMTWQLSSLNLFSALENLSKPKVSPPLSLSIFFALSIQKLCIKLKVYSVRSLPLSSPKKKDSDVFLLMRIKCCLL